jgi:NADH:ubiquinone oxidoreductase subunit K
MLPACIAFIVFSSSLLDLIRGKISATFVIGIVLIVIVSLIPLFYRRYQKKKGIGDPL